MEHQETMEYHLNTNSNTTIKRLFLISLCFLLTPLFAEEATKPFTLIKKVKAHSSLISTINTDTQKFVKGTYKVDDSIKSIVLLNREKKFIRRLDTKDKMSGRFIFIANEQQKYYIVLETLKKDVSYELKIEKILNTFYDEKKDTEKILSKLIRDTKQKLTTNSSTEKFWHKIQKIGTPLIEAIDNNNSLVTFLYRDAKHNVRLLGAPSHDHVKLKKLGTSDIWYKSFKVKNGLRISYQIAPDVPSIEGSKRENRIAILATAQIDPLNKSPYSIVNNSKDDKYSKYSTLSLKTTNKNWDINNNSPQGKLETFNLKSKILQNQRKITVYKPYNYDKNKQDYNLLFVFDGQAYQTKVPTPTILDNLIAKKEITPTIAVFIDNISTKYRSQELPSNPLFSDFMATELLPIILKKYNLKLNPKKTILAGSSYGGLASAYVAYKYPQYFGNVLSLSGSFWHPNKSEEPEWLTREIAQTEKKEITFYLNAGLYETGYFSIDILESNRHLKTVLKAKGYPVLYKEVEGGHDYFSWKNSISDGLIRLLNH